MRNKKYIWFASIVLGAMLFLACKEADGSFAEDAPGVRDYKIKIITPDNGGLVKSDYVKAAKDTAITLTVEPSEGYRFAGITVTKAGGGVVSVGGSGVYTFKMPAADVTVSAVFGKSSGGEGGDTLHGVTMVKLANGSVSANPANAVAGAAVKLTVSPAEGYTFKRGSLLAAAKSTGGAVEVSGASFKMPDDDVTVSAEFEKLPPDTYPITIVEGLPGGAIATGSGNAYAKMDEAVKLTVTPAPGYQLSGGPDVTDGADLPVPVSGPDGDGAYAFTMPASAVTVSAVFAPTPININNPANGGFGWTFSSPTVTITKSGDYVITGTGEAAANRVVVDTGVVANITLENVNIDVSGATDACAFDIKPGAEVNLILASGKTNTLKSNGQAAGLRVPSRESLAAKLTINSAAGEGSTDGTLDVYAGATGAGIGGGNGQQGGTITINGGTVKATSYNSAKMDFNPSSAVGGGAAIGGGSQASGGSITINGGEVTATGSSNADKTAGGASLGGGFRGDGGVITITGGTVNASVKGTEFGAAAIGGGANNTYRSSAGGEAGTIHISGGKVTATGGGYSAGIGSGYNARNNNANGRVTISDSAVVIATGNNGAAIGGGYLASGGIITISGSAQVTATGGENGAGIGGSYKGAGGTITISDSAVVTASASTYGSGIGGGAGGTSGTITINGSAVVSATSSGLAAGIGGGYLGDGGTTIISDSAQVTAKGVYGGAGIGGGVRGIGGTIAIKGSAVVTATGGKDAAGIGGGQERASESISINGSAQVTATGSERGAGIGGGYMGDGGNIAIGDSAIVTATGGENGAAGIGGGYNGASGNIAIEGSAVVTAMGGKDAAGIGGYWGTIYNIVISGGTIIASGGSGGIGIGDGGYTKTTIKMDDGTPPVIFANSIQDGIGGRSTRASDLPNGISANTGDVGISPTGVPKGVSGTLTLQKDFTVPSGATLTLPPGWTLDLNGKKLTNNAVQAGQPAPNIRQ